MARPTADTVAVSSTTEKKCSGGRSFIARICHLGKGLVAALTVAGLVALAAPSVLIRQPLVVWNATASVPTGFYLLIRRQPYRGDLAAIKLPDRIGALAHLRGYVPTSAIVIKPIVAAPGDIVCRRGHVVSVNARMVGLARTRDQVGRPLPRWRGCRQLMHGSIAVLSKHADSFDSRYFGSIGHTHILGVALPVWTNNSDRWR
jgi:conjugative transfer signal peptidase TraF